MNNNLIITSGGMLSASAVIFGLGLYFVGMAMEDSNPHVEASHDKHAEKTAEKDEPSENPHGKDPHSKDPEAKKEPINPAELAELERKYNANIAQFKYKEARTNADEAVNNAKKGDPEWKLRQAEATFKDTTLAAMRRYEKAGDLYSELLSPIFGLSEKEKEYPRYQICVCLLARTSFGMCFDEAASAMKGYLELYPKSPRVAEVQLMYAECLHSWDKRNESLTQVENLLKKQIPDEIRAAAMNLKALLNVGTKLPQDKPIAVAVDLEPAETIVLPPKPAPQKIEKSETSLKPEKHTAEKETPDAVASNVPKRASKTTSVDKISEAQWARVGKEVREGNYEAAKKLMQPWLVPLPPDEQARAGIKYANLVKSISDGSKSETEAHK